MDLLDFDSTPALLVPNAFNKTESMKTLIPQKNSILNDPEDTIKSVKPGTGQPSVNNSPSLAEQSSVMQPNTLTKDSNILFDEDLIEAETADNAGPDSSITVKPSERNEFSVFESASVVSHSSSRLGSVDLISEPSSRLNSPSLDFVPQLRQNPSETRFKSMSPAVQVPRTSSLSSSTIADLFSASTTTSAAASVTNLTPAAGNTLQNTLENDDDDEFDDFVMAAPVDSTVSLALSTKSESVLESTLPDSNPVLTTASVKSLNPSSVTDETISSPQISEPAPSKPASNEMTPVSQSLEESIPISTPSDASTSAVNEAAVLQDTMFLEQVPNVFTALNRFSDLQTLFMFTRLNSEARNAAIESQKWQELCSELEITDSNDGIITAGNILEHGYVETPYHTFTRVLNTVVPVINNPELCTNPETAVVCWKLVHVLGSEFPINFTPIEEAIRDQKNQLIETLGEIIKNKELSDENTLLKRTLNSCMLFISGKINDQQFKRDVIDKLVGETVNIREILKNSATNSAVDANDDSDSRAPTEQVLEQAFGIVGGDLVCKKYAILGNHCIPSELQQDIWSRALDKSLGSIIVYLQSVLGSASPQEYGATVVRVYKAAHVLTENETLNKSEPDSIKSEVETQVLDPIINDFCSHQLELIKKQSVDIVGQWKQSIALRDKETEKLLWRKVPKKSDKKNFMSSFKWAFMKSEKQTEIDLELETDQPITEFEAQTTLLASKLRGMESLVSIEVAIEILELCRAGMHRLQAVGKGDRTACEDLYILFLLVVGRQHVQSAFEHAIKVLNSYDPKVHGRLVINVQTMPETESVHASGSASTNGSTSNLTIDSRSSEEPGQMAVEPLAVFSELVNVGDLVQQMAHVFYEEELVATKLIKPGDFSSRSASAKRRFEQMLDEMLAEGLSRGIDVLIDQVEFTLVTEQLGSDYLPLPTQEVLVKPTVACENVISLVQAHLNLLSESTEKSLFDVFQEEVGMRLFASLCKHIKKQTISTDGAITLIADLNAYYRFILTLKRRNVVPYYEALKRIAQLYLIDRKHAKQLASAMSDNARYQSLIPIDEIVEFVKRRQDWPLIKTKVEKLLYGILSCVIC